MKCLERFSYDLEMITREHNKNNNRSKDWQSQTRADFDWLSLLNLPHTRSIGHPRSHDVLIKIQLVYGIVADQNSPTVVKQLNATVMFFTVAVVPSLFLAAIVLAVVLLLRKYQAVAVVRKLPGPKPNFLFGNALQLARLPDGKYKTF